MARPFFYSPFTPTTAHDGQNPSLLLQFILHELLHAKEYLVETENYALLPFDTKEPPGSLNKVKEHAALLPHAFPDLTKEAADFKTKLESPCEALFQKLEPFILACKENEHLLYFLLKHQRRAEIQRLLQKISPQGIEKIKASVVAKYRKKGFSIPTWMN